MKKLILTKSMLVILILSFALSSFSYDTQKVEIKQEDGVTVVYNPKKPVQILGMPNELILTEELRIGVGSGDEDYMFSDLYSMQVDEDDDVFIYDGKEICIKVFDKHGKFLRKFGTKGQGPEEIQSPSRMQLAGGIIMLFDLGNNRMSFFTKEGKYVKEVPLGKYRTLSAMVDSRGYFYGDDLIFADKITMDLFKFNQDFKPIMTISSIEMPKKIPIPWERIQDSFCYQVLGDDSLLWGRTSKYELNILDRNGKAKMKIVKDYDPVKITKEDVIEELKERYPGRVVPKDIPMGDLPEYFLPFLNFVHDDEGRIYVCTNEIDKHGRSYYDVFDKEERYFLKFSLPENELIAAIKKGKFYTIIRSGREGFPFVKRYKVTWKI